MPNMKTIHTRTCIQHIWKSKINKFIWHKVRCNITGGNIWKKQGAIPTMQKVHTVNYTLPMSSLETYTNMDRNHNYVQSWNIHEYGQEWWLTSSSETYANMDRNDITSVQFWNIHKHGYIRPVLKCTQAWTGTITTIHWDIHKHRQE